MKKVGCRLSTLVTATVSMVGRVGLGSSDEAKSTENSVMVEKDDSVRWRSVEIYEADDYIKGEMTAFLEQRISGYNSSLGKAASSRNSEGKQKLPVALVSVSLENEKVCSVTEYDVADRLVEFVQEIGNYNVTLSVLESGRAAAIGRQMEGVSFLDEKGKATDSAAVLSDGQKIMVKAEGPGIIKAEKKVMYVSEGCELRDSNTVKTPEESISFTVINQYLTQGR